jgi:dienelactone hydrolase
MGQGLASLACLAAFAPLAGSCADVALAPPPPLIHARFDPDDKVIPMPTDVLRDAEAGRLDLPNDDDEDLADLSPAERDFYAYLETMDGWSTLMSATVELTGPVDPASLTADTIQVWRWSGVHERVADVRLSLSADARKITIDPPPSGWQRGERYVVLLRGGALGVRGAAGERVECDAAFYFLRQTQRLDTPEHQRAFPGDTRAEREQNARDLEEIRADLAPMFDWFETRQIPRADVAALWTFTVTRRTELAMDKASQRMPLPIELMLDPHTGRVDAPVAPWDTEVEAEAKRKLADFSGFALSASLLFEFTAPMHPATVHPGTVKLYRLGDATPQLVPADVALLPDQQHVKITPKRQRLDQGTTYLVVVTKSVRDATGGEIVPMPLGHLLTARAPVFEDGVSRVGPVDDHDAEKVERARVQMAAALDAVGRDDVLTAWPFTTMRVHGHLVETRRSAERLGVPPDPGNVKHLTPGQALADFALGIASLVSVGDVVYGTIKSPVFLDKRTRAWREDGAHELQDIDFAMTIPKNLPPGPVPVVIFGHGLVTERRFVLAIGDALAAKGFVAISIDFPYHGKRTYCATGGPISVVNPTSGELVSMDPCQPGTTCNDEGRCVDATGQGNKLAMFPVINMPVASGAVFQEVDHIAATKDHFLQALVDLGALDRSLRTGDWEAVIGRPVDTTRITYAGQSLGGIMGAIFLGTDPDVQRAVLNVPGADLVELFDESVFFGPQMDAFFQRQGVTRDSFEGERMANVARWFMDAVDPMHLGEVTGARALLLQMATLDFIIPNTATKVLEEVTGAPRRDYVAEHGFLALPIEPEYARGTRDMAKFLNGEVLP